jgi:NAD(P)-dependent dehydrogenase (short-subunit alcohol dehydrogenase family)
MAPRDDLAPFGPVWEFTLELAHGENEIRRLFESSLEVLGGRLDILLHVAGISGRKFGDGPLHECSNEAWDRVIQINAFGAFLTNREAVQRMLHQQTDANGLRGTVVNVGSVLDRSPAPLHFGTFAYAASKGAVRAMTLAAAAQYAPDHVRFNLLLPGLVDTPMAARAVQNPGLRSYLASKQPMAGGPVSAGDVAEAALYLCEPASRFVTGAELVVDGGWCISEIGREDKSLSEPPSREDNAPSVPRSRDGDAPSERAGLP